MNFEKIMSDRAQSPTSAANPRNCVWLRRNILKQRVLPSVLTTAQLSSAMHAAESSSARCVSCAAAQSFVNLISREEVPVEAAGQ